MIDDSKNNKLVDILVFNTNQLACQFVGRFQIFFSELYLGFLVFVSFDRTALLRMIDSGVVTFLRSPAVLNT